MSRKLSSADITPEQREKLRLATRDATRRYRERHGDSVKPNYKSEEYREWHREYKRKWRIARRPLSEPKEPKPERPPKKPPQTDEERKQKSRDRYANNREERLSKKRAYDAKNRELLCQKAKEYRANNRESVRAYAAEYGKARWRSLSPEQRAEWNSYNRERYREDIFRSRAYNAVRSNRRRAREKGAGGEFTEDQINALFERQAKRCAACNRKVSDVGKQKYHIDHVQPLARGGSNDISNIQLLCRKCNLSKGCKDPDEWAREHGRLFL